MARIGGAAVTIRFCRHPTCTNLIAEDKLRQYPDAAYCCEECYHTDPAVHERLRRLNAEQWEEDRDSVIERLHTPKAAAKRGAKIAKSNSEKPRRKKQNDPGPGD